MTNVENLVVQDPLWAENDRPLITIITSVLNGADTLEAAIDSVARQSYPNIEYVVVDGQSSDSTCSILRRRQSDIARWISEPDRGVYDAWNKGLRLARGRWVMFLGADDELIPDAVESLVSAIESAPFVPDFVSARAKLRTTKARVVGSPWTWANFRRYCCVAHTGALHNIDYFNRHGEFDPQYRISGDYELLLRAGADLQSLFVDKVVVLMGAGGISKNNAQVFREATRAKLRHRARGLIPSFFDELLAYGKWQVRRLGAKLGRPFE